MKCCRRYSLFIVISLLFLVVTQSNADTSDVNQNGFKLGFGLAFHDIYESLLLSGETPHMYFPISIGSWRFEPTISYFESNSTDRDGDETKTTFTIFGTGIFRLKDYSKTTIYYGLRIGQKKEATAVNYSSETEDDYEKSKESTFIAPSIGGEYYFSEHFSLGGELSFKRIISEASENSFPYYDPIDLLAYNTKSLIILRYYF